MVMDVTEMEMVMVGREMEMVMHVTEMEMVMGGKEMEMVMDVTEMEMVMVGREMEMVMDGRQRGGNQEWINEYTGTVLNILCNLCTVYCSNKK
jgi:hypothetical protein